MHRKQYLGLACALLTSGLFYGCIHRNSVSIPQAVAPKGAWQTVSFTSKVVNVTAVRDRFWVCGGNEMIAMSEDGGHSWQVKHMVENGLVLLTLGFAGPRFGFAAGTGGVLLVTSDGGSTWTQLRTNAGIIYNASFADERNGLIQTPSEVEFTHDGGASWHEVSLLNSEEGLKKYQFVLSLAALSSDRMAILVKEGPAAFYDQRIVLTRDGGQDWKVKNIEHVTLGALMQRNGQYWATGTEVVDRSDRGGHAVSLIMHSEDGIDWTKQPRPAREIENCTSSGCLLWNGAGVSPFGTLPAYWTYPPEKPTTVKWAVASSTICAVAANLACTRISESPDVPAYGDDTPIPAVTTPPALNTGKRAFRDCISCRNDQLVADRTHPSRLGNVLH